MSNPRIASPWPVVLAVFLLSTPLLVLGQISTARLLPGLPLSALMFLTIGIVAVMTAFWSGGWSSVGALLGRVGDWRRARPRAWLVVSLILMPLVLMVEYALMRLFGLPLPTPEVNWAQAPLLLALLFVAAACEELTWSATLTPLLRQRYGALLAAIIIGVFWALLHIVPYYQAGHDTLWVAGQCVFSVAFRVVLVWLFDVTGESLLVAILCHAAYNTAWQLFPNQGSGYNPWIAAGLTAFVAVFAVVVFGAKTLAGIQYAHPADNMPLS